MERPENWKDKPLSEFKDGETLYVQKYEGNYTYELLCAFRSLLGGCTVVVDVLSVDPTHSRRFYEGMRTTTVVRKCFLWGVSPGETRSRYHWFKKAKDKAV